MFDYSVYLQSNYLSRYIHLPEKLQGLLVNGLLLYGIFLALVFLLLFFNRGRRPTGFMGDYRFQRIALFILSILEIAVYHLCPAASDSSLFSKLNGWLWTILGWILIATVYISQTVMIPQLLEENGSRTRRYNTANTLRIGVVFFVLSMLASFCFKRLWPYCGLIGMGIIALQIVSDLINTIKNRSSFFAFLWNSIWMIVCCFAVMAWSTKVLPLLVVIFFAHSFLAGMLHSSDACCGNCRTYRDGHCYYDGQYHSSGDCCDKWQSR